VKSRAHCSRISTGTSIRRNSNGSVQTHDNGLIRDSQGGRALKTPWIGTAAVLLLAACAGPPPLQPQILESPEQVAARARHFWPIFAIETGGHRYFVAVSSDVMEDVIQDYSRLIFVDDRYACREDFHIKRVFDFSGDTTPWEWVSQDGGLDYIADRLLQTCGRSDSKPPRPWPAGQRQTAMTAMSGCCRATESDLDFGEEGTAAHLAARAMSAVTWPVALVRIDARTYLYQRGFDARFAQVRVGMSEPELERILGAPTGSFELPDLGATVKAYESLSWRWYFGVQNDRVIWIHRPYPWLHEMTKATGQTK
jgi:hypothetical protein